MKTKDKKHEAPFLVHWATGPVACCEHHKNSLVGLGRFMGNHVAVTHNTDSTLECTNCINEAEDSK